MIYKILNKILGDPNEKAIKAIMPLVEDINNVYKKYEDTLTEKDLISKTEEFKKRVSEGEDLDHLLPEAFALVKFACKTLVGKKWEVRGSEVEWNMIPFDVQLIGGIVLHQGKIAEMKTGEGKTLVSTLPVYLNALAGKGVHVVTVNDYLAQRDAEWMRGLYNALGLSVGVIKYGQTPSEKREAYNMDITYGTNNEFGFDYLRDNMATSIENQVQRELHYAVVDEVDSILIDEARTPLIISSPAEQSTSRYVKYAQLVSDLKEGEDYEIDEKLKTATLTEEGILKMEKKLGVDNIYTDAGFLEVHHLEQALKALTVYKRDIDYVVKDGEIIIVDEFTGRIMPGRRYSDGLHQAIEAKEGVEIKQESKTLATITFQNYFRLYDKLSGMTGTAVTEAEEFLQIYGLDPIAIPTNKPVIRKDQPDMIFKNQNGKYMAVAKRVKEAHKIGQPVLIGTISIEKSELMSRLLQIEGIPHNVLNAKQHEREAEIVKNAGQRGAVTIATNMAGRGTDIKLGEGVKEVGGLLVIGTERHESRRIDNQLRGRSGRQGDPGESQFFVSMEDDLMRLFGAEKIKRVMDSMNVPEDMPIQNKWISNAIESAQKKVEGHHFDIRKHLVEYDDIMNKHREIIYSRRNKVLSSSDIKNDVILLIEKEVGKIIDMHISGGKHDEVIDYIGIFDEIKKFYEPSEDELSIDELERISTRDELFERIKLVLFDAYSRKESLLKDVSIMRQVERSVYLNVIDTLWMEHIDNMQHLRESVALQGYAQKDPLIAYKEESFIMFNALLDSISMNTVSTLFKIDLQKQLPDYLLKVEEPKNIQTNKDVIVEQGIGSGQLKDNGNPVIVKANGGERKVVQKVGRNELCPCGSGKKYKKCCGKYV